MKRFVMLATLLMCALPMHAQALIRPQSGFSQSAQLLDEHGPRTRSIEVPPHRVHDSFRAESRTHWRTGLIAGGVVGFFLAAAAAGYDDSDTSIGRRLGLGLVGAAVLSMPSALLGGLFPKSGGGAHADGYSSILEAILPNIYVGLP